MVRWWYLALGGVALAGGVAVAAFGVASAAWHRTSQRLRSEIMAGAVPPARVVADAPPTPVARYLARSIPAQAGRVAGARLDQEGEFQTGKGPEGWRPFTAVQTMRAYPPAFLWDARISAGPFVTVRVRDGYRDGQGGMTAKIGGLITVMDAPPSPGLAEAALVRYLAEAPWMPTRLMPGNGLSWMPGGASSAVATLTDGPVSVSVTLFFDDAGDIVGVRVPNRGREVDGAFVPTPWVGRFWDHGVVDGGFRSPRMGEVAWVIDGDTVPYWRGRVTAVSVWSPG